MPLLKGRPSSSPLTGSTRSKALVMFAGGIFDRIELLQDGYGTRFRDRDHERIGALEAARAPIFKEIGLFMVPEDFAFDPTEPWELQLLVQRATGAREKAFLTFDLAYALPDRYIKSEKPAETSAASCRGDACSCCGGGASLEADVAAKPNIDWHHRLRHCLFDGHFLLPEFCSLSGRGSTHGFGADFSCSR